MFEMFVCLFGMHTVPGTCMLYAPGAVCISYGPAGAYST